MITIIIQVDKWKNIRIYETEQTLVALVVIIAKLTRNVYNFKNISTFFRIIFHLSTLFQCVFNSICKIWFYFIIMLDTTFIAN